MELIIKIDDEYYNNIEQFLNGETIEGGLNIFKALEIIRNGTPLDEIKAEIEKQIERDFAFAETETLKVPCHYGTANGLQVAVRIIDSYKSEVQDGQGSSN